MYVGNGAARKFILPTGKDGSIVVLKLPGGTAIRMKQGESYTVHDGAVYFYVPVPSGVVVSFDDTGAISGGTGFTVIYEDGTMETTEDDPAEYLDEIRDLLTACREYVADVERYASSQRAAIQKASQDAVTTLSGELERTQIRGAEALSEAVKSERDDFRRECNTVLQEMYAEGRKIRGVIPEMEGLRGQIQGISTTAARDAAAGVSELCREAIASCEGIKGLPQEIGAELQKALEEIADAGRKVTAGVKEAADAEIRELKSLRVKMETDYQILNGKINNRWELLKEGMNER